MIETDAAAVTGIQDFQSLVITDGSPESAVKADTGSLAWDETNNKLYVKDSGDYTNTGWVEVSANAVQKSLYDANSILYATSDNTPVALTVGASTFVGRKASGGISAMSVAEVTTLLATSLATIAEVKAIVAGSVDFAEFKTNIAAWADTTP